MAEKHEREKDKGAFLRDTRFVTDNFNVYEVAEEMDKAGDEDKKKEG
jgi:hypothetical protein